MEKRKHRRLYVRNMHIDVSDGIGCCTGTVRDISRLGLCLADMAKRFGKKMDTYTVVATSENRRFKFRVRPRWEQVGTVSKRMGVEIPDPPSQWTEFVVTLEAQRRQ